MRTFATDRDRLAFLMETDAVRLLESLEALADVDTEPVPDEVVEPSTKGPGSKERPKYITNYIGSKQRLIDWIWRNTPQEINSVIDAFSGSAVVSYMYKSRGLAVTSNDRLRFSYHAARAIVENKGVQLSDDEIALLLADNPKAGTFVQDNFSNLFFAKGVHAVIDSIRANLNTLRDYKKDIALFALGKTCMSGKGGFGHFTSSTDGGTRKDTPEEFRERFRKNIARINSLVFDNGKECKAFNEDIVSFLPQAKGDLAYFDPPYATEFSTTNYEKAYHFVEGLMTYWDGLTLNEGSKIKDYQTDHKTVTKANAREFFQGFLGAAKHVPNWLISYRDHAHPTEKEMRGIISSLGRDSRMKSHDHHYSITSQHGDASQAKERLFICKVGQQPRNKAPVQEQPTAETPIESRSANIHTSIPVVLSEVNRENLCTQALEQVSQEGDPQFTFVLCRVGTNKNGDHFTREELSGRYLTALNKKIDLKHSQDFTDIVGGIVAANFIEDEYEGGYIECVGELYVSDSVHARLSYKLIKKLVVSQVSMECDYEEGECSICGKRVKSKEEYCVHLRKYKGQEFQGKPVYEILHGVTFTGLGLLDRKGADDNARITQVGSEKSEQEPFEERPTHEQPKTQGEELMVDKPKDEKTKETKNAEDEFDTEDKSSPPGGGDAGRVKELEKENRLLRQKLTALQKKLEDLEAAQKAAANRARAEKLVSKMKDEDIFFKDETDLTNELERLADLSDDAFAATEAAIDRMIRSQAERRKQQDAKEAQEKDEEGKGEKGKREKAKERDAEKVDEEDRTAKTKAGQADSNMRSSADVRPHDVDDAKASLEDELRDVLMSAYRQRVSFTFDDE